MRTNFLARLASFAGSCLVAGTALGSPAHWEAMPDGPDGPVAALRVHEGLLYAGGSFAGAGGVSTPNLAAFDGNSWRPGPGLNDEVLALVEFGPAGESERLVAGGMFNLSGRGDGLARLVGGAWQPITGGPNFWVAGLGVTRVSGVPELVISAGFIFGNSGYVAKWNGSAWSGMGDGLVSIAEAYTDYEDGAGRGFYANQIADGATTGTFLSRWDGAAWSTEGAEIRLRVNALCVFDDGRGPGLYAAGGKFATAGVFENIAVLRGGVWSHVGAGLEGVPAAMAVFDDGRGPRLYVAAR